MYSTTPSYKAGKKVGGGLEKTRKEVRRNSEEGGTKRRGKRRKEKEGRTERGKWE